MIERFNAWFDSLPGTWRFLVILVIAAGWAVPLNLATLFQQPVQDVLLTIGAVWLIAAMAWSVSRGTYR